MAKQSFTSEKYQAVIRIINRAIVDGVHNDDLRKHVMKAFKPDFPGGNDGTLEGVRMTAKGLSTYIANVKAEAGLSKAQEVRPVATIIKKDNRTRSVCKLDKDHVVVQVWYGSVDELMDMEIPKDTAVVYGYQIVGAPLGTVINTEIELQPTQKLVLKAAKSK